MTDRKSQQELVVITKTYDLILWSRNHTGKFPRNHRFVLGSSRSRRCCVPPSKPAGQTLPACRGCVPLRPGTSAVEAAPGTDSPAHPHLARLDAPAYQILQCMVEIQEIVV
jgi:hypothetical protein